MRPIVGWGLGGPCVRQGGVEPNAWLGEPTWSPSQLLRNLELRLGLPPAAEQAGARVPSWSRRLRTLVESASAGGAQRPFFASSFASDSLGTAKALLAWRDDLIEAGWNGQPIAGGGDRLDAMAALEQLRGDELPPGLIDRIVRVEAELRTSSKHRIYDGLVLVEDRSVWSTRWRSIFTLLEERGARIETLAHDEGQAPASSDLGVLQEMLRGKRPSRRAKEGSAIKGDGTLLLLRGDTPGDLAELTAAVLTKHRDRAAVVRCADAGPLETALGQHGHPHQGHAGASAWRPAMQLLPLALELAYEPRDPYRVLELLTLPIGPFQGLLGGFLARAVSKQPGIGGTEWVRQKEKAAAQLRATRLRIAASEGLPDDAASAAADAYVAERLQRVAEWIEARGADATGASRMSLLTVAKRVATFLQKRLASSEEKETYAGAYGQAQAMTNALAHDHRELISREDMRHLLDSVVRGAESLHLTVERAGRIDHVDHPSALLAPANTVVFWSFVGGTERHPRRQPWQRAELSALEAAGVLFPDLGKLLAVESESWRRGILAARERVIFVVPATMKSTAMAAHPTWDEVAARLGLEDDAAVAPITRSPSGTLARHEDHLVSTMTVAALRLPESRPAWGLPPSRFAAAEALQLSATALDTLASCPLRFVLGQMARIRPGALAKVASGPLLSGSLGHRLVEELHREQAFDLDDDELSNRANAVLATLLETEGATLLLEGASFERSQFVPQLVTSILELRRFLLSGGWHIVSVEEAVETSSSIGTLRGRLDVRLANAEGKQAVLDLKWGESSYRALIEEGRAVQLAAYVRAVHAAAGKKDSLPPAAYFALGSGRVITADARMGAAKTLEGPTLDDTWRRVEKTARAVQDSLRAGRVFVAATKKALPLLDALAIPQSEQETHYTLGEAGDACRYCDYPVICGKAWEATR